MGRLVRYSKDQGDNMSSGQKTNQPYKLSGFCQSFGGLILISQQVEPIHHRLLVFTHTTPATSLDGDSIDSRQVFSQKPPTTSQPEKTLPLVPSIFAPIFAAMCCRVLPPTRAQQGSLRPLRSFGAMISPERRKTMEKQNWQVVGRTGFLWMGDDGRFWEPTIATM